MLVVLGVNVGLDRVFALYVLLVSLVLLARMRIGGGGVVTEESSVAGRQN
jgi:hypothetical protein